VGLWSAGHVGGILSILAAGRRADAAGKQRTFVTAERRAEGEGLKRSIVGIKGYIVQKTPESSHMRRR
jgi:hypothetical protein